MAMVERLKHEVRQVIPPTLFFFVAFQLIVLLRALVLEAYGVSLWSFTAATVGALVIAKVVVLVDLIPAVQRFADRPLLWSVAWKTAIYVPAALAFHLLEHLIPLWWHHRDLAAAWRQLMAEVVWSHASALAICLVALFLVYCSIRELSRVLGWETLRRLYFGPREPPAA